MKYLVTGKIIQVFEVEVKATSKRAAIAVSDKLSVLELRANVEDETFYVAAVKAKLIPDD